MRVRVLYEGGGRMEDGGRKGGELCVQCLTLAYFFSCPWAIKWRFNSERRSMSMVAGV